MRHLASLASPPLLLERDTELAAVARAVEDAKAGSGRFVVVEAASGLGKSRLLAEARALAAGAGMRTLRARGVQLEQGFGFGLVRQLFEPLLEDLGAKERRRLLSGPAAQATAALHPAGHPTRHSTGHSTGHPTGHSTRHLTGHPTEHPTDHPARHPTGHPTGAVPAGDFAALHGLYWLIVNLSRSGPLAVVADDVHWSDAASLKFLNYLLPRLEGLPLVVIAGLRPRDPLAHQHLIDIMTTDPAVTVLRLAPLTEASSAAVVRAWTDGAADGAFCSACHRLAGGNPLLLYELVSATVAGGVPSTAAGVERLGPIGGDAIGQRIRVQLAALPSAATALARALAVLDENTEMIHATAVAGLDAAEAVGVQASLVAAGILRPDATPGFLHPLYRAAVYQGIDTAERTLLHRRAARVLAGAGARAELVSAHLMHVPPAGDAEVVDILRRGAAEAVSGAAPETALRYLERALEEPPAIAAETTELLVTAGSVAQLVDWEKVVPYLRRALEALEQPERRAAVVELLGRALFITGRNREAAALYQNAIIALGPAHDDLRQLLQASLINVTTVDASLHGIADELVERVRDEPRSTGAGGRMLDALTAWHDGIVGRCRRRVVVAARRALDDGGMGAQANGFADACWVLTVADHDEVMSILEAAHADAHRRGSMVAAATVSIIRSLGWLHRGSLAEAETDARQAAQLIDAVSVDIARPITAGFLADILLEQGRLDEAEKALRWADSAGRLPATGHVCWLLAGRARLSLARGRLDEGIELITECGRRFEAHGWRNPAFLDWRSDAALALHASGRPADARHLADEALQLTREWAAPRPLGRALRVAGLVAPGAGGLALLRESVDVLEPSTARLEHAKALHALGGLLRKSDHLPEARSWLAQALDLADRTGATALADQVRAELRAAGGRPRRTALSGPDSLTPSEGRVAELAAAGHTNRHIAQTLFVTPKTVEVHLSSIYRKLNVTNRREIGKVLIGPTQP